MTDSKTSKAWGTIKRILSWFFGLLFALLGIYSLTGGMGLTGLFCLAVGLYLIPSIHSILPVSITGWVAGHRKNVVYSSIAALIITSTADFYNLNERRKEAAAVAQAEAKEAAKEKLRADYMAQRGQMLAEMKTKLEAQDYKGVMALARPWNNVNDGAKDTYTKPAQVELKKIADAQTEKRLVAELKDIGNVSGTELVEVIKKYKTLVYIRPQNKDYKAKLAKNQTRLKEYKAELAAEKARQKKIQEQFSSWDGSHRELERVIKEGMNDPDSYVHVRTVYWDEKDYLIVSTTFRGKNVFGGVVKNTVTAKVALDGTVLQILAQY